jgi:hypothetical protein
MKHLPLAVWLTLVALSGCLEAVTFPVSEDTSARGAMISKATGSAANLPVAANRSAYIRFDLAPGSFPSADAIERARLVLYVQRVLKPGTVKLNPIGSEWSESVEGSTLGPTIIVDPLNPLAEMVIGAEMSRQFVTVDVTDQVKKWIEEPGSNFGICVESDGPASILLGAKEGPGSGYPASLEIERKVTIDNDQVPAGIDVVKLGNGSIDNSEFTYLDGLTGAIQLQINGLDSQLGDVTGSLDQKVKKAGDTMTGTLNLPNNGLLVGADQLAAALGRIGIGTTSPASKLDVRGDIKLGTAGQYFAPSSEENLRIIRGTVRFSGGALTITAGSGFTVTGPTQGGFNVVFNQAFAETPTVTATPEIQSSVYSFGVKTVTPNGLFIVSGAALADTSMHFIAIGPR